jgi:hypothetical protein
MIVVWSKAALPRSRLAIVDQPGLCPLRRDAERKRYLPGDNNEGLRAAVIDRNSPAGRPGQWCTALP